MTQRKKVLVVGHSYVPHMAQTKWVAASAVAPDLHFSLVVPQKVKHVLGNQYASPHPAFPAADYHVLSTLFSSDHMRQVLSPLGLRDVISRLEPDIVHIEADPYSVMGAETILLARRYARGAKFTFFTWDNLARMPPPPKGWIKSSLTNFGFGSASLVFCGNREAQQLLHDKKNYSGKSVVLPQLGVEDTPALYQSRTNRISRSRPLVIGFIGRLIPEKGLRVLLEAFSLLSDLNVLLLIVGAGSMWDEINRGWRAALGSRLEVRPAVPHDQVPGAIAEMDIFVLPSLTTARWKEQFGLTLPIAMLTGAACVGSSSAAIPEVIGDAGYVVPEGDAERLAATLRRLVTSGTLREQMGEAARRRALAFFTHDSVAERYAVAFREVLSA